MAGEAGPPRYNRGALFELTEQNAGRYLNEHTHLGAGAWTITLLGGGISNTVLLAESAERRVVLKQSLPKLRVAEDWPADRSRIRREWLAIECVQARLPAGAVPAILFTDTENCIFGMTAAPAGARTWKAHLLEGDVSSAMAHRIGVMLGIIITATRTSSAFEAEFGALAAFEQLRLDPYYAFTASRHPELAPYFEEAAEQARTRRVCLVHGDWSPKNFLVSENQAMAIDWEVAHYGDPSFDAAFLLNHLLLKSLHRPLWATRYLDAARSFWSAVPGDGLGAREAFEEATCRHLGCLLLARIDGKSPVEYITSADDKERIRGIAARLIRRNAARLDEFYEEVAP